MSEAEGEDELGSDVVGEGAAPDGGGNGDVIFPYDVTCTGG